MANGLTTRICDMSDSHLANAIANRELNAEYRSAFAEGGDWFHEGYDNPLDGDELYNALVYEQTRREVQGITVPVNYSLAVAAFKNEPLE